MHPKALLDACAELVKLVLRLDHPADAVVSRYFRDNRGLGPRERATLAETAYTVLRRKLLFEHLAPSGSGPKERRLAILGFAAPRDFLKSALTEQEKAWLDQCDIVKYGGFKASAVDAKRTLEDARTLVVSTTQTTDPVPAKVDPAAPPGDDVDKQEAAA